MQKLTKTEESVMQQLWDIERGTVSDLLARMEEPRPPHSTLSSVVRILEKKGYVGFKAYGKTYEYFPIISRADYGASSLSDVMQNYFGGSARQLVSHLLDDKKIAPDELEHIIQRLQDMDDQPTQ
jgi:BlaI family transcriptional regulator, penicillinase repressor